MNEGKREEILGRIREALRVQAPRRTGLGQKETAGVPSARRWLPAVPEERERRLELFRSKSVQLKTGFHVAEGIGAAAAILDRLRKEEGWTSVGAHHHPLIDAILEGAGLTVRYVEEKPASESLERCSAGVTGCDALIAQTGSILVTSRSAGGRSLSVLPPHHVVVATADQLLPDLPAAFDLLYSKYGESYPSFVGFVTGPSRTGDIERIIVLGAHGPRALTVILVDKPW